MARKYLIPFLSVILTAVLAFALQAYQPSWRDFLSWFALWSLVIGCLELAAGLVLLLFTPKHLARQLLFASLFQLLLGVMAFCYIYLTGGIA